MKIVAKYVDDPLPPPLISSSPSLILLIYVLFRRKISIVQTTKTHMLPFNLVLAKLFFIKFALKNS